MFSHGLFETRPLGPARDGCANPGRFAPSTHWAGPAQHHPPTRTGVDSLTDGDGQSGAVIRVEHEHEAIGPASPLRAETGELIEEIDVRRLDPIVAFPTGRFRPGRSPRGRARNRSAPSGAVAIMRMRRLRSCAGRREGRLSCSQDGLGRRQVASSKLFTFVVRIL